MTKRIALTLLLLLVSAGGVAAQDIPLSQILVDGEGWQDVTNDFKALKGFGAPRAVTKAGHVYTITGGTLVRDNDKATLPEKLVSPSGLVLWPDEGTLVIGDAKGKHLWAFRIEKDGTLSAGDGYYALRVKPGEKESHVSGLAVDDKARLYAYTPLGIQVFDPTGRLCGVIRKPAEGDLGGIALGGEKGDMLMVVCGDAVYARKVQGKSVLMAKPK